jgi:polar amino acid transport system substrate-binding protein
MVVGGVGLSAKDKLVVGMELAYPPFEMTDKQGNPEGLSVDLAKAFGKYLGREVEIQNIAWDGLIPALKTGKVDVVISSMTITEEREKTVDFSEPYSKAYLALLVSKGSPVVDVEDLNKKGRTVAVKKGSTGHMYARDNLKEANMLILDKESSAVLEVVQGRADAFIYDQLTIFRNWKNHKDTTRASLRPFQEDYEYWGMAFKDGSPLVEKANDFIAKFREDGGFDRLGEKHLKEVKETFKNQGIPFFL